MRLLGFILEDAVINFILKCDFTIVGHSSLVLSSPPERIKHSEMNEASRSFKLTHELASIRNSKNTREEKEEKVQIVYQNSKRNPKLKKNFWFVTLVAATAVIIELMSEILLLENSLQKNVNMHLKRKFKNFEHEQQLFPKSRIKMQFILFFKCCAEPVCYILRPLRNFKCDK